MADQRRVTCVGTAAIQDGFQASRRTVQEQTLDSGSLWHLASHSLATVTVSLEFSRLLKSPWDTGKGDAKHILLDPNLGIFSSHLFVMCVDWVYPVDSVEEQVFPSLEEALRTVLPIPNWEWAVFFVWNRVEGGFCNIEVREWRKHPFRYSSKPLARRPSNRVRAFFFLAACEPVHRRFCPVLDEPGQPLRKEQPGFTPGCDADAECVTSLGFGIPEGSKATEGRQHQRFLCLGCRQ